MLCRPFVVIWVFLATALMPAEPRADEGDAAKGAKAYYICYNCHSLEQGVHLTGPSLAGLWGKQAGSVEGFSRYSKALQSADLVWDETTLDAWFADPQAVVPSNTMIFNGIEHDGVRANLTAFLKIAMGPGGAATVVAQGLLSAEYAAGRVTADLSRAGPAQQVTSILHCGDAYLIKLGDGDGAQYWERNLHFKTDTGPRGPADGVAVLVPIGSVGDRASVVFSSPANMARAVDRKC